MSANSGKPQTGNGSRSDDRSELRPSLVPAIVPGLASLIVPGLGQLLASQLRRGLILMGSLLTFIALLAWRINLIATRQTGWSAKLSRALNREPFFIGLMIVGIAGLWLWNAWDAYRQTDPAKRDGAAIFVLIVVLLFTLG